MERFSIDEIVKPQQIILEKSENWTTQDFEIIKSIFPYVESVEECVSMWQNNSIVRIADAKDYRYAYEDYLADEEYEISFDEFIAEFKKGYGNSKYLAIARLFELSNGIWYDNEYC